MDISMWPETGLNWTKMAQPLWSPLPQRIWDLRMLFPWQVTSPSSPSKLFPGKFRDRAVNSDSNHDHGPSRRTRRLGHLTRQKRLRLQDAGRALGSDHQRTRRLRGHRRGHRYQAHVHCWPSGGRRKVRTEHSTLLPDVQALVLRFWRFGRVAIQKRIRSERNSLRNLLAKRNLGQIWLKDFFLDLRPCDF